MSELGLAVRMLLLVLSNVCIIFLLLRMDKRIENCNRRIEVIVGRDGVVAPSFVEVRFVESALATVANEMRKASCHEQVQQEGGAR